jgi:adenine-specific DNA-methyltransferase
MRGGTYRFQAQYLRRIRVPERDAVDKRSARALAAAFLERDAHRATAIASRLYGVDLSGLRRGVRSGPVDVGIRGDEL